ncbi:MAG: MFS transporter, partial [Candidatus Bathyarchaeia archaeon]
MSETGIRSYPRLFFEMVGIGFTVIMGMSLGTSFLPILARELDPSGVLVGLVVSVWFLSRIFIELPAGIVSDRIGRRKLLIVGVGLSSLGSFLCARAGSIYVLILGRGLWGFGSSLYFMCNTVLIMDLIGSKERGQALGIFHGIEFIGSFIGTPIGAFLAAGVGYSNVFYFTFALTLCSLLVATTSRDLRAVGDRRAPGSGLSVMRTLSSLRSFAVLAICVCTFFRMFIMQGIFSTVFQLHLKEELLFHVAEIGVLMSLRTCGHILATLSSGFLSAKFGREKVAMAGFLVDAGCLAS